MRAAAVALALATLTVSPRVSAQAVFADVLEVERLVPPSGAGYDLFDVRDARTLASGGIAALNVGTSEVFVFSSVGRFVRRFGGEGEGPGEFTDATLLWVLPGDSILVTNLSPQKGVVFTADGTVARTFTLERPPSGSFYVFPRGVAGGVLVTGQGLEVPAGARPGPVSLTLSTVTYDMEGRIQGTLVRPEVDEEMMVVESAGQLRPARLPLRRNGVTGTDADLLVMASTTSRDVLVFGPDLRPGATIRAPAARARLTPDLVDEVLDTWIDEASNESARAMRLRAVAEAAAPQPPMIEWLEVDKLGRVWVAEANPAREPLTRWHVYAGQALLGYVDLPVNLDIREIGADYVLAIETDELDVETIVRVRLRVLR